MFDIEAIRNDFPILKESVHGQPLVYLDTGATAQKPQPVLDAIMHYYQHHNSNVHRGAHALGELATIEYDRARIHVAHHLHCKPHEVVFVRGTTEAINVVADCLSRSALKAGDTILITTMEHHANIVPWQQAAARVGAKIEAVQMNDLGELDMAHYAQMLEQHRPKVVSFMHVSNVLGTINPAKKMTQMAKEVGATVLIDGAQSAPHIPVDVVDLGCDFYVFSGHKAYGPMGIGVLYGTTEALEQLPPYQSGGGMIEEVTIQTATFQPPPAKFEAGTPNVAGAVGLGAALKYLRKIGMDAVAAHGASLCAYGHAQLEAIPGLKIIGNAPEKVPVLSFVIDKIHAHDVCTILDREGLALRGGHHCAQPLMEHFGIAATTRASMGLYNTKAEIDQLVAGLKKVQEVFDV